VKMIICKATQERCLREALELIRNVNKSVIVVLQPNSFEHDDALDALMESFRDICYAEGVTSCIIPQMHKAAGIR